MGGDFSAGLGSAAESICGRENLGTQQSFSFAAPLGTGNSNRQRLRDDSLSGTEGEDELMGNLDPSPFQIREVRRAEIDLKNAPVLVPPPLDGHVPRTEEEELRDRMRDNEYFDNFSRR